MGETRLAGAEELRRMTDDTVSRGLGDGRLQADSLGTRKIVDLATGIADEVVVVLLLHEAETALAGTERELAEHPLGDQDPQGPIDGRETDAGLSPAELPVNPVDRRVGGVPTEERKDGVTVQAGSRHGPPLNPPLASHR
jgi:hypothetical protein